jgi:hypothetical protein
VEAAIGRFLTPPNANGEIAANKWKRRREYLIPIPQSFAIATIASLPVDQSLTLWPLVYHQAQFRGPHPLHLSEQQVEEARPIDSWLETIMTRYMVAVVT